MKPMIAGMVMGACLGLAGCATIKTESAREPDYSATHEDLVLSARWDALVAEEGNQERSREGINHARSGGGQHNLALMRGQKTAGTEMQLDQARAYVKGSTEGILKSRVWPAPPAQAVRKASGPITVDGKGTEADWSRVPAWPIHHPYAQTNVIAGAAATCRLLWDEKQLYLLFEAPDTNIVNACTNRDEAVSQGDCVEIFLLPSKRFGQYWEFNFSPSGVVFDSLMSKFMNQWGSDARNDENASLTLATTIDGTLNREDDVDRGYTVEVAIPWTELPGFQHGARSGDTVWTMIGWANKASLAVPGNPAYYSHTPVLAWFHNIWGYSQLTLE